MNTDLRATVTGLFIGKVEQHWEGKPPSAIAKNLTPDHSLPLLGTLIIKVKSRFHRRA